MKYFGLKIKLKDSKYPESIDPLRKIIFDDSEIIVSNDVYEYSYQIDNIVELEFYKEEVKE